MNIGYLFNLSCVISYHFATDPIRSLIDSPSEFFQTIKLKILHLSLTVEKKCQVAFDSCGNLSVRPQVYILFKSAENSSANRVEEGMKGVSCLLFIACFTKKSPPRCVCYWCVQTVVLLQLSARSDSTLNVGLLVFNIPYKHDFISLVSYTCYDFSLHDYVSQQIYLLI